MGSGGSREGAGRPSGAKNYATRARMAQAATSAKRLRARYDNAVISMDPLQVACTIACEAMAAGDVATALEAAALALPYTHERKGVAMSPDEYGPSPDEIAADTDPEVKDDDQPADPHTA